MSIRYGVRDYDFQNPETLIESRGPNEAISLITKHDYDTEDAPKDPTLPKPEEQQSFFKKYFWWIVIGGFVLFQILTIDKSQLESATQQASQATG